MYIMAFFPKIEFYMYLSEMYCFMLVCLSVALIIIHYTCLYLCLLLTSINISCHVTVHLVMQVSII